jgi:hypothetical protein
MNNAAGAIQQINARGMAPDSIQAAVIQITG